MRSILLVLAVAIPVSLAQPLAFEPEPPPQATPPAPPQASTRIFRSMAMGGSFLGVGVREVDAERAKALKLKEEAGVEVTHVEEDSPASKAGLKESDVILQYNGQRVEGFEQFSRLVRETPAGREVHLLISREGRTQTVNAKIAGRKPGAMAMPGMAMPHIEMPPMIDMPRVFTMWRSAMLGVEGEALSGQLAEYFGVKEGVLVRAVVKDTAAAKAGIKAGDVIVKVNDVKVTNPSEISSAIRSIKGKAMVPVMLLRDHREMVVNATIDADRTEWESGPRPHIVGGRTIKM